MKRLPSREQLFQRAIWLGIITTTTALILYGYLGTFSRYSSDDYCLSAFYYQDGDLLTLLIDRYVNHSSRWTNILFIVFVDNVFGWYNPAILPALMLTLFVWGLYLLLRQIIAVTALGWSKPLTLLSALLIIFFSVVQSPNLYETLFWRAGMTSHFAPLALLPFLCAYMLKMIRTASESTTSVWTGIICFIAAFMLGGFSEPPVALMITVLALILIWFWWQRDLPHRRKIFNLVSWTLAGFVLALIVLALAPANANRLENSTPSIVTLITRTIHYPILFIVDDIQKFPLPTLISFALPFFAFYTTNPNPTQSKKTIFWLVLTAILTYLLIASTFAPSIYGQNYPIARARFAGRFLLTTGLLIKGALLGILANQLFRSLKLQSLALVLFILTLLYPLRMVPRLIADIPEFQTRATAWDERDTQIRTMHAEGQRGIIVPFLRREIMQDLGDVPGFRLNRCASMLYDIDWIVTIDIPNE